ncbi:MAG: hypothetical protein IJD42_05245 [Clostridia bacterium]|nr:hypothetical protein [Clostridia bacterium]
MIKKFNVELEGQLEFYEQYLKVVNPNLTYEDIFRNNSDGILNANLLEFKLNITDLNACLFQAIKYLSSMRIKGEPIPSNILLVSLNTATIYLYKSEDYLDEIEKVYIGGASRKNVGFFAKDYVSKLEYGENQSDEFSLIQLLRENKYTKIHIDENCIVGWAEKYYRENPQARKADFIGDTTGKVRIIGEIREPDKFKEYIYPYAGKNNVRFQYLMDRLNDALQKKNLGAFYTPEPYVDKSIELVRQAIARVPQGNDYIILDRCAGTGNLEKRLTDEELSHCIVSTIEYYEYKVLLELLGSKVRYIIPPTEKEDTFNMGLVRGADALSEEYINNPVIKQYIDNPKCTVILFENPPYVETTSLEHQRTKQSVTSSAWKNTFVVKEMKKEVKGAVSNDLSNAFIWSAFKYYLRQPTDSYVVYSPVKYWKSQHLINKEFLSGFAFNRRHFHTHIDACIMCALWSNVDANIEAIKITGYDIMANNRLSLPVELSIVRVHELFSTKYYNKENFEEFSYDGILTGLNGLEADSDVKCRIKPLYSKEMLGYLVADSVGFDNPDAKSSLLVAGRYNGNGCYLKRDDYLSKLPMFCASRYILYNREWTERARIMKSADGADKFFNDVKNGKLNQFLLKCLVFTCFEMQNHMRTFIGSDNRFYRNELCLDITNGETIASKDLKKIKIGEKENELFEMWKALLKWAKKTKNYNPTFTYGVYQIFAELNTFTRDEETGENKPDYPELNGALKSLKQKVKEYYITEIVPTLFEYEFLK